MHTVLLIDDEDIVRVMLQSIVDWNKYGFGNIIEASNGKQAIDILKSHKVDLIITDIRMPVMDGLELLDYVSKNYSDVPCIVMTAYDEFEYVRTALRSGVYDFIIKSEITLDLMQQLLLKIHNEIQSKKAETLKHQAQKDDDLFQMILGQGVEGDSFKHWLEEQGLIDKFNNIVIIHVLPENWKRWKTESSEYAIDMEKTFHNMSRNFFSNFDNVILLRDKEEGFVIICGYPSVMGYSEISEELTSLVSRYREMIWNSLSVNTAVGVSEIGTNINPLYKQARLCTNYVWVYGPNCVTYYRDIATKLSKGSKVVKADLSRLEGILAHRDINEMYEWIDLLSKEIKNNIPCSIRDAYKIFIEIILFTNQYLKKQGLSFENVLEINTDFYEKLQEYITIDDIILWFKEVFEDLFQKLNRYNNLNHKVRKVIEYIERHYSQAITLEQMAEHVNVSPTYLSKLFVQEVNQTFTDYLIRTRMEKAKDMLVNTELSVTDISKAVGYYSVQHFSKMFRKVVHKSPTQFRENRG